MTLREALDLLELNERTLEQSMLDTALQNRLEHTELRHVMRVFEAYRKVNAFLNPTLNTQGDARVTIIDESLPGAPTMEFSQAAAPSHWGVSDTSVIAPKNASIPTTDAGNRNPKDSFVDDLIETGFAGSAQPDLVMYPTDVKNRTQNGSRATTNLSAFALMGLGALAFGAGVLVIGPLMGRVLSPRASTVTTASVTPSVAPSVQPTLTPSSPVQPSAAPTTVTPPVATPPVADPTPTATPPVTTPPVSPTPALPPLATASPTPPGSSAPEVRPNPAPKPAAMPATPKTPVQSGSSRPTSSSRPSVNSTPSSRNPAPSPASTPAPRAARAPVAAVAPKPARPVSSSRATTPRRVTSARATVPSSRVLPSSRAARVSSVRARVPVSNRVANQGQFTRWDRSGAVLRYRSWNLVPDAVRALSPAGFRAAVFVASSPASMPDLPK